MSEQDAASAQLQRQDGIDEALGQQLHVNQQFYQDSLRSYGQSVLRGLFLLNGGASIALLTLIGSIYSKDNGSAVIARLVMFNARKAVWWFGLGLLLSVLCSGLAI